jgi:potassium-dependent mechanosensitive channel
VQVHMIEISVGLVCAVFVLTFGYAVAFAVFAPDAPARRLVVVGDQTAGRLARHLVWGSQALAALVVVLAANRAVAGSPSVTIAANMVYALVIAAILLHLLFATRVGTGGMTEQPTMVRWLRVLGWLILAVIVAALVAGYVNLAAFVAVRLVSLVAVVGLVYLLLCLASPHFAVQLATASGGQSVGAQLELRSTPLGPRPALTSACIFIGLILAGIALAIGPW